MANNIIIELTDVQEKALQYIANDPVDWLNSFVQYRVTVAVEEIYKKEVERLTAAGAETIPTNKEQVVLDAFNNGHILTAAESNAKIMEQMLNGPLAPGPITV